MTFEQMERTMQFILDQQARVDTTLGIVGEKLDKIAHNQAIHRLARAQEQQMKLHEQHRESFDRIAKLHEQHRESFDRMGKLHEQHNASFDRINALLEKAGERIDRLALIVERQTNGSS